MRRQKKTRTREHIIASQSVAHLESFVFACGFTAERVVHDYGYDLNIYTYDPQGGIENGNIYVQLKATDHLTVLADGKTITQTMDSADILFWLGEIMPVILVVYDALNKEAYWLYVQESVVPARPLFIPAGQSSVTLRLSKENIVNEKAVERFRELKNAVLAQKGAIQHNG